MISDFVSVKDASSFLKVFVVFLIVMLINVLIIRFLWNTVLVKYIKVLAPVNTLFDTFLLAIALTILRGSCCK